MYFQEKEVKNLMQDIAGTFTQAYLMFDTIPEFISKKTMSEKGWMKTKYYKAPKMPWGINRNDMEKTFKYWISNDIRVIDVEYSGFPRGFLKYFFLFIMAIPGLRNFTPSIVKIIFENKVIYNGQ
jgi:hypothetical protein